MIQVNAARHLQLLHSSVLLAVNESVCPSCNLIDNNIRNEELSCRGITNSQQIFYRARIIGTEKVSAGYLVSLIGEWIQTKHASLLVGLLRLHIDSRCTTPLDSLLAPDCVIMDSPTEMPVGTSTTLTVETSTIMATEEVEGLTTDNAMTPAPQTAFKLTSGEIGGLAIGCIIVVLLIVFIVLLIIVIIRCFNNGFR